jgi:hypothetical protein
MFGPTVRLWFCHDKWKEIDPKKATPLGGGVYVCDFNRDGIPDLLVTDLNRFALYQGLPGRQVDRCHNRV